MERARGRRLPLVALLVGLVLVAAVGPTTASSQHATAVRDAGHAIPSAAPVPVNQDGAPPAENELDVTLTLSMAPNRTGVVRVRMTVENPDAVEQLGIEHDERVTVQSTDGYERRGRFYRWDGETGRPTATYLLAVNRTSDAHLGSGLTAVDAGSWALFSPPDAAVSYGRIPTQLEHGRTEIVESYEIEGEGVLTSEFVYLGPHRIYETYANKQTIRLVVPRAASMTAKPDRVLATLANASGTVRIGGRDETVTGLVAPTAVEWATGGSATGSSTFRVPADAPLRTARNTWVHEYVHTREAVAADRSMAWLSEAAATYYGATIPLKQGLTGFGDFRSTLEEGTDDTDVRLAEPSTWNYESDYRKGALVLARLDLQIRAASDGTHTLDDAISRLQSHDDVVDAETFARAVANVSSPEVGTAARQYVTTTATPEPWSLSEHARHFGYAPAHFFYGLSNPRAVGPTWSRNLKENSTIRLLPSERLVVEGVVRNDGGRAGPYDVTFRTLPGDLSDPRPESGLLFSGWTRTYSFTVDPVETGRFFAVFGASRTDQLKVEIVEPSRNVTVSSLDVTPPSAAGDAGVVSATVTNPADRPARTTVPITVDGRRVDDETVVLGGGETTEIRTEVVLETVGHREIGVDGATTTIQVGTPTPTTDETRPTTTSRTRQSTTVDDTGETPTGSGGGPGFGVVAAVLALASLIAGRARSG